MQASEDLVESAHNVFVMSGALQGMLMSNSYLNLTELNCVPDILVPGKVMQCRSISLFCTSV